MEKLEQPEYDVDSASGTEAETAKSGERLNTVEDYKKAYAEMRAAFTRKTQELARVKASQTHPVITAQCEQPTHAAVGERLEEEKAAGDILCKTDNETAEETAPQPAAVPLRAERSNPESSMAGGERLSETDRDEIIKQYLQTVASQKAPPVIAAPASDFAFTNLDGIKSLNQVEKVVADFFKTKSGNQY